MARETEMTLGNPPAARSSNKEREGVGHFAGGGPPIFRKINKPLTTPKGHRDQASLETTVITVGSVYEGNAPAGWSVTGISTRLEVRIRIPEFLPSRVNWLSDP